MDDLRPASNPRLKGIETFDRNILTPDYNLGFYISCHCTAAIRILAAGPTACQPTARPQRRRSDPRRRWPPDQSEWQLPHLRGFWAARTAVQRVHGSWGAILWHAPVHLPADFRIYRRIDNCGGLLGHATVSTR